MRELASRITALSLVAGLFVACGGSDRPKPVPTAGSGGDGGSGGAAGTGLPTGGSGGSGGSGGGTGGSGGSAPADSAAKDAPLPSADGAPDAMMSMPDGATASDGGAGGPILTCWPDPKVIMICLQLENACENCGPNKGKPSPANPKAQPCFDLVDAAKAGKATDADCAKHAKDNDCTIDDLTTTGNLCGSLTCDPATCSGTHGTDKNADTCEKAKGWGDSSQCAFWYAKCPCK